MKKFKEPVFLFEETPEEEIILASELSGYDPWGDDWFDDDGE